MNAEPSPAEKLRIVRAGILADRIARAVRWAAFAAVACAGALPLAWRALREHGAASGFAVLALTLALAWHVKPHGRSLAAQCRDIDARHGPPD